MNANATGAGLDFSAPGEAMRFGRSKDSIDGDAIATNSTRLDEHAKIGAPANIYPKTPSDSRDAAQSGQIGDGEFNWFSDKHATWDADDYDDPVPLLEIRVFGGFDIRLDGRPIDTRASRQRRVQTLMSILALNHGQELYSDYLADSIWPRSTPEKKRHCFYNLWYLATHTVYAGPKEGNPYFERLHRSCRLLDDHTHTDVEEVDRACAVLSQRNVTPTQAMQAYNRLQAAYRGDLLPGEMENTIVTRAREEWRERVSSALSSAAQTMKECGEDRTALWFATAACRLVGIREDVVRLRMELLAKMGMQAYAVRAYNELEDYLRKEVGVAPSPQSTQMMQQVIDSSKLGFSIASSSSSRRRGSGRKRKADFAFGDAFTAQPEPIVITRPAK